LSGFFLRPAVLATTTLPWTVAPPAGSKLEAAGGFSEVISATGSTVVETDPSCRGGDVFTY
jgi:hypothetical protein